MQDLNIADAGFSYIIRCVAAYYEGTLYFFMFLAALAFCCLYKKDTVGKRMRQIFLPQFILMALTVYNPLFPVALNSIFDINKEYYRFLWMSPVIICIATVGALFTEWSGETAASDSGLHKADPSDSDMIKGNTRRVLAALAFSCILIAGGSFLYEESYIPSPNIYHMPSEIPKISEIIHEDADTEYPRAMFEYDYQMQIRQYDAGILLSVDREQYLRALTGEVDYDSAMEEGNYIDRLLAVVGLGIRIPEDRFASALKHTGTEYVVVSTKGGLIPYLKEAGLTVVGETENHTVMHYEPKEPQVFEKPDYSEVWRLTPQWYDFLL